MAGEYGRGMTDWKVRCDVGWESKLQLRGKS